ncbi:MAG TPA: alpha-galactosidase [Bacteroidales bacterium]|nr:alpha-galactosidase [Bacteroidales bacterium]HCB62035.1 alpha-galactosidase [Bacteroidales bacterium]HCY23129.1 alpha-galactosidase [Bacteroidales bacterium]
MGWNSWNLVEANVSDEIIREIADSMVANGMRDAGFQYIIIDDFWVGGRDAHNKLFPDPIRFPHGIKPLSDYVHSKGLKLGIYSDAADRTCGGVTGSLHFETIDAQTFAEWGIDYLKYDYCHAPTDVVTAFQRYKTMGDALKATGRPIVYAICEWGQRQPWLWARAAGGHLWRTTYDSRDTWYSHDTGLAGIMDIFELQHGLEQYAGPGGWNDPDMLMVGLWGKGKSSSPDARFQGCTFTEYRTHFALWAMLAAPLILNCDVRNLDQQTKNIILNNEIIAIDQDSLGVQGEIVFEKDSLLVISKPLQQGDVAICILNRKNTTASYKLDVQRDLNIWFPHNCRDIFNRKNLSTIKLLQGKLESHDCAVFRFEMK